MKKTTLPLDTIVKISQAMSLLNHESLDDSEEVNQAYNILESILEDLQFEYVATSLTHNTNLTVRT